MLEDAGYLAISKSFEGKRPRTRIAITREGRTALDKELEALRQLVSGLAGDGRRR